MPGKWRKEPFSRRVYEPLQSYVVTNSIQNEEGSQLLEQLKTPLNGYLGQAYNYDDHDLTEEWMQNFQDKGSSKPSDDDVIRTQIVGLMDIVIAQVQDRICNREDVLSKAPLLLGKDLKEAPVWGVDCYTRRMIELSIEDHLPASSWTTFSVIKFIEKTLLPAINAQPSDKAHNMTESLHYIIQSNTTSNMEKEFSQAVLTAIGEYGLDVFRIHPKGTGVICINPEGIPGHVFVTEYLGELYPSYRWCERMDVIEQAQKTFELKPTLPDFYNILLERPRQDPNGYGLLYVDASQKANIGSSCSHSCDPNCTSAVVARNGKLAIVLTTNRKISYGEELTMDYYSITNSDLEWRAAICLCGMSSCRGSFLHYATQDDLQQVLNLNCGPLWRYASLLRACSDLPIASRDMTVLSHHGVSNSVLGHHPPTWMQKYAIDILRFIEFERKALPCALLRSKDGSPTGYTYSSADMDARCVMEQRIQSMVCCFSMVDRVASKQKNGQFKNAKPLVACSISEAVHEVWERMRTIPRLIEQHLVNPIRSSEQSNNGTAATNKGGLKLSDILPVLEEIETRLKEEPKGIMSLREACLQIKNKLKLIETASTAKARLGQLADVVLLWAYTTNFSYPQEFDEIVSDPITVNARELGTNIPRSKIFKAYNNEDRKRARSCTNPQVVTFEPDYFDESAVDTVDNIKVDMVVNEITSEVVTEPVVVGTEGSTTLEVPESVEMSVESDANTEKESISITELVTTVSDTSALAESTTPKDKSKDFILSPNEPVFQGMKTYGKLFCFWQLMGWYNAGTDEKLESPELFGCAQLPDPSACFGAGELTYGPKQREQLLALMRDERQQTLPWPASLKATFSASTSRRKPIYGSPFLDTALGQVDALYKAVKEMISVKDAKDVVAGNNSKTIAKSGKNTGSGRKKSKQSEDAAQFDNILPPEMPTSWVQCESCKKWRRVPWHIDAEQLSEMWVCTDNTWDPESANCDAPQDEYDPNNESTLEFKVSDTFNNLESCKIGQWRDVYCVKNLVYYEAQIKKLKEAKKETDKSKILFHYKGWSSKFDEWIEIDSERIKPHNLFTNPDSSDPREQEAWQGLSPIKPAILRTAFRATNSNKRKSGDGGAAKENDDNSKRNKLEESFEDLAQE